MNRHVVIQMYIFSSYTICLTGKQVKPTSNVAREKKKKTAIEFMFIARSLFIRSTCRHKAWTFRIIPDVAPAGL